MSFALTFASADIRLLPRHLSCLPIAASPSPSIRRQSIFSLPTAGRCLRPESEEDSMATEFKPDVEIRERGYNIGVIGGGMIVSDVHLAAYQEAGFKVGAIASRNVEKTKKIAERYGIGRVHESPEALIADPAVEILDIAYPPDLQPALIRQALKQDHIKGILAQKPLALSLEEAIKLREEAQAAGKVLSVNQNMRYDQSKIGRASW